jgi:hypothetical protein
MGNDRKIVYLWIAVLATYCWAVLAEHDSLKWFLLAGSGVIVGFALWRTRARKGDHFGIGTTLGSLDRIATFFGAVGIVLTTWAALFLIEGNPGNALHDTVYAVPALVIGLWAGRAATSWRRIASLLDPEERCLTIAPCRFRQGRWPGRFPRSVIVAVTDVRLIATRASFRTPEILEWPYEPGVTVSSAPKNAFTITSADGAVTLAASPSNIDELLREIAIASGRGLS